MSHKISSSTSRTQHTPSTLSTKTKTDARAKRHGITQRQEQRQSFAQRLEDQQTERLDDQLSRASEERVTRHDVRQLDQDQRATRHEGALMLDERQRDGFEHALREEQDLSNESLTEACDGEVSALEGDVEVSEDVIEQSDEVKESGQPVEQVSGEAEQLPAEIEDVQETSSPQDVRQVAVMAEQLVQACHVGQDKLARKVMMLDVDVPGKGQMRVRLTRDGDGVNVRMRASDESTRSWLKAHQGQLRDEAAARGVVLKRIDVV